MTIESFDGGFLLGILIILFVITNAIALIFEPKITTPKHRAIYRIAWLIGSAIISFILWNLILLMITSFKPV